MTVKASDLEIFVLSYNRANYIEDTIQSLLKQTKQGFSITVLDNGSTDDTEDIINTYGDEKIKFIGTDKNMGVEYNFKRAQTLASKDWVMVFHDDDLLHPKYIESALRTLNKSKDSSMVVSSLIAKEDPSQEAWENNKIKTILCTNSSILASKCYMGFSMPFSSIIYKTTYFKQILIQYNIYGKMFDRPFVFEAAGDGLIAILLGCPIQYRVHSGQDSMSFDNGPFKNQMIALHKKYLELLGDNLLTKTGWSFVLNNYRHLRKEFARLKLVKPEIIFKDYIDEAIKHGGATRTSIAMGKMIYPFFLSVKKINLIVKNLIEYIKRKNTK